jgi:energy-coupling factor transporter transmembrane protein EcfT
MDNAIVYAVVGGIALVLLFFIARFAIRWAIRLTIFVLILVLGGAAWWWFKQPSEHENRPRPVPTRRATSATPERR